MRIGACNCANAARSHIGALLPSGASGRRGKDVASARYDEHAHDKSTIDVTLQPEAARRMLDVTRKNIGLKVGVVINGQLLSVAMIAGGTAHVWIAGLPQNTAESLIGAFQRLHRER